MGKWTQSIESAKTRHADWQSATYEERLKIEAKYSWGMDRPIPEHRSELENLMRAECLEAIPMWLSQKCTLYGFFDLVDILYFILKEVFPAENLSRINITEEVLKVPEKVPTHMGGASTWLEDWITRLTVAERYGAQIEPQLLLNVLQRAMTQVLTTDPLFSSLFYQF